MTNRVRRVVLTGGGSGGHVYPLLAVVEELQRLTVQENVYLEIFYIGPHDQYTELLRKAGVNIKFIAAGKIRRYASISNLLDIPRFFIGAIQAFFKLYFLMPDVVFSKGGTGALPVIIAAWFYRVEIMIHESDAIPGLTNSISSRFASRIAVSFQDALHYFDPAKTAWTGSPVRPELFEKRIDKKLAKQELGFNGNQPLTIVLGGSQGSQRINEFIVTHIPDLIKETQLLHIAGTGNYVETERLSKAELMNAPLREELKSRYKLLPYLSEDISIALSAADFAIARSGSGTIFEFAAFGVPAILIPLPESAQNHQKKNAYAFSASGGGVVIEESNLSPGIFLSQLRSIIKKPDVLAKMSEASAKFFKPGAAEAIAQELINIS